MLEMKQVAIQVKTDFAALKRIFERPILSRCRLGGLLIRLDRPPLPTDTAFSDRSYASERARVRCLRLSALQGMPRCFTSNGSRLHLARTHAST